jgi:hypothetical protein
MVILLDVGRKERGLGARLVRHKADSGRGAAWRARASWPVA